MIARGPRPPRRVEAPYGMLSQPSALIRGLMQLLFGQVYYAEAAAERVRTLGEAGTLAYLVRGRSAWLVLGMHHLLLRLHLPLARVVGGVSYAWMQPMRGLWHALRQRRLLPSGPWSRPDADVPLRRREALVADAALHHEPVLIVLPAPRSTRAHVRDINDYLRALIVAQQHSTRPIFLLPHVLVNREQSGPNRHSVWRRLALLFALRRGSVRMADPIDLKAYLERAEGGDATTLARRLRYDVQWRLSEEERVVAGPNLSPFDATARRVLRDPWVRTAVAEANQQTGESDLALEARAQNHLGEIAARYDVGFVQMMSYALNLLFNRIYDGIAVDEQGLQAAMEAARQGPLVFCPSHRSHIDYLVLSYVLWHHGMAPPHIAAGANLAFFPLGFLFRRCGAFFLRRSFQGDGLYTAVFRAYVAEMVKEGAALEFFLEGTRSRTGKMLPPKLGLLATIVNAWRRGVRDDVVFVPVSIDYERIIEAPAYERELQGGDKAQENIGNLLKSTAVLRSRYGRVQVQFGDPLLLAQVAREAGLSQTADRQQDEAWRREVERLGFNILHRVGRACSVTPMAVVATALLAHPGRGMAETVLVDRARQIVHFLTTEAARIAHALAQPSTCDAAILAAVAKLCDERLVVLETAGKSDQEPIYRVPDETRAALDFHKNALMNTFAPAALVARALRRCGPAGGPFAEVIANTRFLTRLMKQEFIYQVGHTEAASVEHTLASLAKRDLLTYQPEGQVSPLEPDALAHLAGLLDSFLQAYWICARTLLDLSHHPLAYKDLVARAVERVRRAFLEGLITRPEAANRPLLESALQWMVGARIIEVQAQGRRRTTLAGAGEGKARLVALIDEVAGYI